MATRSLLKPEEIELAEKLLEPLKGAMTSVNEQMASKITQQLSLFISNSLQNELMSCSYFDKVHIVETGSWSRQELTPKSDIDVLVLGSDDNVTGFITEMNEKGVKFRYRTPKNEKDWTEGVGAFDVLGLLHAKALDREGEQALEDQKQMILSKGLKSYKGIVKAMAEERASRTHRYDSISNYLEPNIKYGPGGLRDLQQALYILELFDDRFEFYNEIQQRLILIKSYYLVVRAKLHLSGLSDLLIATEQKDIAHWLGFETAKEFMRYLQTLLSDVSFYTDYAFAVALSSKSEVEAYKNKEIKSLTEALKLISVDHSLLAQGQIRKYLQDTMELQITEGKTRKQLGKLLKSNFKIDQPEGYFVALFNSGVLEQFVPALKQVKGLVQHDQYHRYSVDAHLLQAIKVIKRVYEDSFSLGRLDELKNAIDEKDWNILLWSCLYHDLAKGMGGDHSEQGAELVKQDFTEMGLPLRQTLEVSWIVENHLLLSLAAFRLNPQSSSTWKRLHRKGVKGKRLLRLALFTAIDIIATNPDAWTDWKERLLYDLVAAMKSKQATHFMRFFQKADESKVDVSSDFIKGLDGELLAAVDYKTLIKDYKKLKTADKDLPVLVVPAKHNEFWIRFHSKKDQPGLFLNFVQKLHSLGGVVRQCSVQTFSEYGVYDWFKVKSDKSIHQIEKILSIVKLNDVTVPDVSFDRLKLMSEAEDESVISFRGRVQPGVLISAAHHLFNVEMEIRWAKVHTWGRQFEGVFSVKTPANIKQKFADLKNIMITKGHLVEPSEDADLL